MALGECQYGCLLVGQGLGSACGEVFVGTCTQTSQSLSVLCQPDVCLLNNRPTVHTFSTGVIDNGKFLKLSKGDFLHCL